MKQPHIYEACGGHRSNKRILYKVDSLTGSQCTIVEAHVVASKPPLSVCMCTFTSFDLNWPMLSCNDCFYLNFIVLKCLQSTHITSIHTLTLTRTHTHAHATCRCCTQRKILHYTWECWIKFKWKIERANASAVLHSCKYLWAHKCDWTCICAQTYWVFKKFIRTETFKRLISRFWIIANNLIKQTNKQKKIQ